MTTTIKVYSYKNFSTRKSTGKTVWTEIRAEITKFNNIINNYDLVIDQFINDCEGNMKELRIIFLLFSVLIASSLSEGKHLLK